MRPRSLNSEASHSEMPQACLQTSLFKHLRSQQISLPQTRSSPSFTREEQYATVFRYIYRRLHKLSAIQTRTITTFLTNPKLALAKGTSRTSPDLKKDTLTTANLPTRPSTHSQRPNKSAFAPLRLQYAQPPSTFTTRPRRLEPPKAVHSKFKAVKTLNTFTSHHGIYRSTLYLPCPSDPQIMEAQIPQAPPHLHSTLSTLRPTLRAQHQALLPPRAPLRAKRRSHHVNTAHRYGPYRRRCI